MTRLAERRKGIWDDDEESGMISSPASPPQPNSEQIDRKLKDFRLLVDQTHQLYLQYFNGIEKRPPVEKRKLIETQMVELQRLPQAQPTQRFKIQQAVQHFLSFKDLWERKLRDRERK